jgi:hypothetical protein
MYQRFVEYIEFNRYKSALIFLFALLAFIFVTHPKWIWVDMMSYIDVIKYLKGDIINGVLRPNRLLSVFGAMWTLVGLEKLTGDLYVGWALMNSFFYVICAVFFFKILYKIFKDEIVAIVGTLLLIFNYAILTQGLAYGMDIGGWAFYLVSAFFTLRYLYDQKQEDVFYSAFAVSIGVLFKEYAFGGLTVLLGAIAYSNFGDIKKILKLAIYSCAIALIPIFLVHIYVYIQYSYTYYDWYLLNANHYSKPVQSKLIGFVKTFGSLYNFGWFFFVYAGYLIRKNGISWLDRRSLFFSVLLFVSVAPVFFWPGAVQRGAFITMPFIIIVSCIGLKEYKKYWFVIIPLLILYIVSSYLMDSYILPMVDIDSVLRYFVN